MEKLERIAHDIAMEVKQGKWPDFTEDHQNQYDCLAILTEFQSRAIGYNINDYVHALSQAIEKEGYS